MESWLKISLLLCTFGFLKELRPSEPFLNDFLVGEWRNVTQEEITREVYPVATYAYLAQSIIVLIITDFLRYKPLIILSGMAGIVIWCLLLWTESLAALQLVEVVYGTYMATEVAYYTYIYAKVDREHFSIVTSHTRAAIWSGKFIAAVIAQVLVYNDWMDYRELNFLSLGAQICATVWALFLPSVKTSIYFNRKNIVDMLDEKPNECLGAVNTDAQKTKSIKVELENAFKLLFSHCITAYSNKRVLVWSLWYAFALGGYLQVISYIQGLWSSIDDTREAVWNGGVEATLTLTGAVVALLAGYLHGGQLTQRTILWALGFLSMVEGAALFIGARTTNLWIAYSGYLIYGILYSFTITVASAEVAKNVSDDSFGLIFGINTAIALAAQCILTLSVVSYGFQLDFVEQFTVYGCYYMTLGAVYFIVLIIHYIRKL